MQQRSQLYSWLSMAFHIPTEEIAGADYAAEALELQRLLFPDLPGESAAILEKLGEVNGRTGSGESTLRRLEDLKLEYARLFLGPPRAIIYPFESIYYGEKQLVTAHTAEVAEFYRSHGVQSDPAGHHEPADHIAVELEFLSMVCAGELLPGAHNADAETVESQFLAEHLGNWGGLLARDITAATEEPLFLAASLLLEALITHHGQSREGDRDK